MLIFAALHKFNHTKKEKKTHNGHRKNGTIVYFTDHNLIHDKTFKMPKKKIISVLPCRGLQCKVRGHETMSDCVIFMFIHHFHKSKRNY